MIVGGAHHTCGLKDDQSAVCWGRKEAPAMLAPGHERFRALTAGYWHTCGLRAIDSTAVCWGNDANGQMTVPKSAEGVPFASLVASSAQTCGLREDGSAICWGLDPQATPPVDERFSSISAGEYHTCGVRKVDSAGVCWGLNHYGQSDVPANERFNYIVAGGDHSCGLRKDGTVACWGLNGDGQASPPEDQHFRSLVAGVYFTCGQRVGDNAVVCWGRKVEGQLVIPDGHKSEEL
mmetsp:Transcript_18574/g.38640  ORF Transcript_18574/g.38640 Transcript_18574/m.38640 type:complete len:235 (+) Transcript_18574:65-769(+)